MAQPKVCRTYSHVSPFTVFLMLQYSRKLICIRYAGNEAPASLLITLLQPILKYQEKQNGRCNHKRIFIIPCGGRLELLSRYQMLQVCPDEKPGYIYDKQQYQHSRFVLFPCILEVLQVTSDQVHQHKINYAVSARSATKRYHTDTRYGFSVIILQDIPQN